jgi:hypothetical protein
MKLEFTGAQFAELLKGLAQREETLVECVEQSTGEPPTPFGEMLAEVRSVRELLNSQVIVVEADTPDKLWYMYRDGAEEYTNAADPMYRALSAIMTAPEGRMSQWRQIQAGKIQSPAEKRQEIERRVIRRFVDDAIKADYYLSVDDGGNILLKWSRDADAIMKALMTVGAEYLLIHRHAATKPIGHVYLVYGNDGYDVINDYTINLEHLMAGANEESAKAEDEQHRT